MSDDELTRKNIRTGLTVLAVVVGMVALSFASVPLYSLFCRVTGFGGTTQTADTLPDRVVDRAVTVQFNADTGRGMPWDFRPEIPAITVKLGARGLTAFHARNRLNRPTAGTALYNVTPLKAGKYFHKIACFCFGRQELGPGEDASMPVMFYIDPALNDDPGMRDVKVITLSYTFYEADSKDLEQAMTQFYNEPDATRRRD